MSELLGYLKLSPLFKALDDKLLNDLAGRARWVELPSGKALFNYGEPGDALYVVATGRLRVSIPAATEERVLADVGRGEVIGELAVVTGDPRSATVRAIRDSALLRIGKDDFDHLLERHPSSIMCLARIIVQRLQQHSGNRARDTMLSTRTIAMASAHHPALPFTGLAREITATLSALVPTRHIDSAEVDAELGSGISQTVFDESAENQQLLGWLNDLEGRYRYLLYQADPEPSAWTARCLRQADRILLVVDAVRSPEPGPVVKFLHETGNQTPVEILLVHQGRRVPKCDPMAWREVCSASAHHHIVTGESRHVPRVARHITGNALGVTFSGGGARGFAHLGLVRALEERNVSVDMIGGTSIGAFIGALMAMGLTLEDMTRVMRDLFVDHKNLNDYTWPFVSLIGGRKLKSRLEGIFGNTRIEDLELPYFCITANLTRACQMIHDRGRLLDWVSTSMAVPGIAPPTVYRGDLLVDGGIVNNLPTDVMQKMGRGHVIGSDVSSARELRVDGVDTTLPQDLRLIRKAAKAVSIASILVRTATLVEEEEMHARAANADLYLRMPVQGVGMFDWKSLDMLINLGYQQARDGLKVFLGPQAEAATAGSAVSGEQTGQDSLVDQG